MSTQQRMQPNPRRSEAAKRNRAKRKGLTEEGRKRLSRAAIEKKPWLHVGPATLKRKLQSVINGKVRQKGEFSVREARAQVKASREFLQSLLAHTELGVFDM